MASENTFKAAFLLPVTLQTRYQNSSRHGRFKSNFFHRREAHYALFPFISRGVLQNRFLALLNQPTEQVLADKATNAPENRLVGLQHGLISGSEVTSPIHLQVLGRLPPYLGSGTYYQNGPGVFDAKHKDGQEYVADHLFDGLGMVNAFFLDAEKGTVKFRSKMTSESVKRTIESVPKDRHVAFSIYRSSKPTSILSRLSYLGAPSLDPKTGKLPLNFHVTLQQLPTKGILNASTDYNEIHRLDVDTLETVEEYNFSHFHPNLADPVTSSHGVLDSKTGEYFNFMLSFVFGKAVYKVFRILPSGQTEIMTMFKDHPYYLHSFSITPNYVILILWPSEVSLLKLLKTKSLMTGMRMRPDTPTKFVVISRKTNQVVSTYEHEAFFCLHTVHAFEQGDNIFIDLSYYKDLKVLHDLRLDNLRSGGVVESALLMRFTLSDVSETAKAGSQVCLLATSKALADFSFEFGVVAPSRQQKSYQYAYGLSAVAEKRFFGEIVKLDVDSGQSRLWSAPGTFLGEPYFVQDPLGKNEDDGSLLMVILDTEQKRSALVVLDARTMQEVARAVLPMMLPLGFHGFFRDNTEIEPSSMVKCEETNNTSRFFARLGCMISRAMSIMDDHLSVS